MDCFRDDQRALWERGYPYLVELQDGHKDDAKPEAMLAKLNAEYFGLYTVRWPRKVAECFVRACASHDLEDFEGAAGAPGPIGGAEVRAAIAHQLASIREENALADGALIFCAEALAGTDVTLEALVDVLSTLSRDHWPAKPDHAEHRYGGASYYAYLAGFLLLRASPAVAKGARAKLEALWKQTVDADVEIGEHSLRGGLDLALHGTEGAKRVLSDSHWQYLHWWGFVDDAEMIRTRYADSDKSEFDPDPRHAWLCPDIIGEVVLKKRVRGLGKQKPAFFEALGTFAHPAVAGMMAEWTDDKLVGALAQRWLADHPALASGAKAPAKTPSKKPSPKPAAKKAPKKQAPKKAAKQAPKKAAAKRATQKKATKKRS